MWVKVAAGAMVSLLGGGMVGCAPSEVEPPTRTRAECGDDPALIGCAGSLPTHMAARKRKAEQKALDNARRKRQARTRASTDLGEDWLVDWSIPPAPEAGRTCQDVTTYDWNWDNDVLCTDTDGSQFYTSYEGANAFLGY